MVALPRGLPIGFYLSFPCGLLCSKTFPSERMPQSLHSRKRKDQQRTEGPLPTHTLNIPVIHRRTSHVTIRPTHDLYGQGVDAESF